MRPEETVEPVTAVEAADRLDRAPSTIRCWALRYNARQLRKIGKRVYYDFADLAVIHRELQHGHPVPATPEDRVEIRLRCPLKSPLNPATLTVAA
ncbi:MAG TPA: hypothetical protein VHA75_03595 [Rugosimonospora sp.]|nr:hypothetical protein [Rugosimonospora sp.]